MKTDFRSKRRIRLLLINGITLLVIVLAGLATSVVFAADPAFGNTRPLRAFYADVKLTYGLRAGDKLNCRVAKVRKQGKKYLTRVQCVEFAPPAPTPTPTPVVTEAPYPYPYPNP